MAGTTGFVPGLPAFSWGASNLATGHAVPRPETPLLHQVSLPRCARSAGRRGPSAAGGAVTANRAQNGRAFGVAAGMLAVLLASRGRPARARPTARHAGPAIQKPKTELDTSGPMPFVKLTRGKDEATVYLRGACLASYQTDGVEWLGLRADAKLDGSKPNVSGGLPICFPQFGPGDPLGRDVASVPTEIPVHGLARNMDWKFMAEESTDGVCVLELTDTEETLKLWPHEFRCLWRVELTDGQVATTLSVQNLSASECSFTCGLHSYFHVTDIDKASIRGDFNGCTMLHRTVDPAQFLQYGADEITISQFTDDIYKDVLPGSVVLSDPTKGDLTIRSNSGWQHVVVWNPYGNEGLGYKTMVCVENVATDAIVLAPQDSWEASMDLEPETS